MPAESDWVLLAPYNDVSLLRDVFAFTLWREMGHWAPRTRMVEVVLNGKYVGVYADRFLSGTSTEKRPEFQSDLDGTHGSAARTLR